MSLEARELFYQQNVDRLEHMAFRAIKKGLSRDQFVMVAIDVDDPSWTEIVDVLILIITGKNIVIEVKNL